MDLLHRYLNVVAIRLPERERDDIVAELREELLSQVEERQARLRRMLTTGEFVGLLKAYGHPFVVAARYNTGQRHVGPELLPFRRLALQLVLGVVVMVHAFGAAVVMVAGSSPGEALQRTTQSLWIVSMYMIGVVMFSFFVMDRLGVGRWVGSAWSPRFLPPAALMRSASGLRRVYDWTYMVILSVWAISAFYWPMLVAHRPWDGNLQPLPVWSVLSIQLMVVVAAQLSVHFMSWVAPGRQLVRISGQILVKSGVLVVLAMFFRHKPWFEISVPPTNLAEQALWILHFLASAGLILLAMLAFLGLLIDALALVRRMTREEPTSVATSIE
jgi:hypothetical protein